MSNSIQITLSVNDPKIQNKLFQLLLDSNIVDEDFRETLEREQEETLNEAVLQNTSKEPKQDSDLSYFSG